MSLKNFDLWRADQVMVEVMAERLFIAKLIESLGVRVDDSYEFYVENHPDPNFNDFSYYVDTIDTFLSLSGIGNIKDREIEKSQCQNFCIQFNVLEEIAFFNLNEEQKERLERWMEVVTEDFEFNTFTIEGRLKFVGTKLYGQVEGMYGFAFEFCEELLQFHQRLLSLLKELRRPSKGEIN